MKQKVPIKCGGLKRFYGIFGVFWAFAKVLNASLFVDFSVGILDLFHDCFVSSICSRYWNWSDTNSNYVTCASYF